jgi:hypothetical protein
LQVLKKHIYIYTSIVFFLLLCCVASTAQNNCTCNTDKERLAAIDYLLDQKDYLHAEEELSKLSTTDPNCYLQQLQFRTASYALQAKFTAADSCLALLKEEADKRDCKNNLAAYYLQSGFLLVKENRFDSALTQFLYAQQLAMEAKDSLVQLNALLHTGNLFNSMQQSARAVEYDRKTIQLAGQLNNYRKEIRALSNMQAHFGVWYDLSEDLQYIDSVKVISKRTLQLAKKYRLETEIAQTWSILAGVAYVENNFRQELIYTDSALIHLDRKKDFRFLMSVFQKKCDAYIELKDYKAARVYGDSCRHYASLEKNPLSLAISYERLYEVEKLSGNVEKALFYHERYTTIRDSIRSVEKTKVINEMEQKYNRAENEKRIGELAFEKDLLNKEKEISSLRVKLLIGIVAAIVFVLIAVIFFYRQSVIRSKLQKLETEQRLNRARMNPHFFFNVLASIQSMMLEEEDPARTAILISKFSKIMRQSLESSYNELVTVAEEEEFLTHYLDLQRMRYENKFRYTITIADNIDPEEVKLPAMLLQPFAENAIEHGFKNIGREGSLEIRIEKTTNGVKITCKDNGQGFQQNNSGKAYPSRANQIAMDRLFLLNQQLNSDAHFETGSNPGNGTTVTIHLPLILEPDR